MTVLDMFKRCVNLGPHYIHTHVNKGSYFVEYDDDTLYVYFQGSNDDIDWKNNFDFGARPYRDMSIKWRAHRGFVRVWKEIEPFIKDDIMNQALAVLAHEYAWFNRPDIRDNIFGYGFEAPRVFCGRIPEALKPRWENFYVFRNGEDIVTHVPPFLFGFKHTGNFVHLNKDREILVDKSWGMRCVSEHHPANVIAALTAEEYDKDDTK